MPITTIPEVGSSGCCSSSALASETQTLLICLLCHLGKLACCIMVVKCYRSRYCVHVQSRKKGKPVIIDDFPFYQIVKPFSEAPIIFLLSVMCSLVSHGYPLLAAREAGKVSIWLEERKGKEGKERDWLLGEPTIRVCHTLPLLHEALFSHPDAKNLSPSCFQCTTCILILAYICSYIWQQPVICVFTLLRRLEVPQEQRPCLV